MIDRLRERDVEVAIAFFGAEVLRRDPLGRMRAVEAVQLIEDIAADRVVVAARREHEQQDESAAHESSMA